VLLCGLTRSNAVAHDQDVDVFLLLRTLPLPEAAGMNQHSLMGSNVVDR